ncbi:MAG: InlB B-repeat-containing protein [Erysipelotrichaceae bacterium]|nr:InlB B-repeat-containing protein [Erysipelotrichaceae bacterium]
MQTKRNNKILSFLFSIFLLICLLPTNHIMAFDNPTLKIENATGHTGELINVSVKLYNNPGVASSRLTLNYGSSLTLEEITFVDDGGVVPDELKSGMTVTWMSTKQDVVGDITFMTLKFRVTNDLRIQKEENITITNSEFVNYDEDDVFFDIVNGSITLIPAVPGDINNDGVLNMKDVVRASRYLAGHNVDVDETAIDTNGDQKINIKDLMRLLNYLVNNDVKVYYGSFYIRPCKYEASHIETNKALCETDGNIEYWYCEKCDKYYSNSDATLEISLEDTIIEKTGHNIVIDEAIPATKTSTGLTEGAHCSDCLKVIVPQIEIPILAGEEKNINIHLNRTGDSYLGSLDINTSEIPTRYIEGKGLDKNLPELEVEGYMFLGWYNASVGGQRIFTITSEDKGDIDIYAHWKKNIYTIHFNSGNMKYFATSASQETSFTVSDSVALEPPEGVENYRFVGWTDENNNFVDSIKKGTANDIYLTANWSSYRNQAIPHDYKNEAPLIMEYSGKTKNSEYRNVILFVYEIGTIENIPIKKVENFQEIAGIGQAYVESTSIETTETEANQINGIISKETSNSTTWTLSSNWNNQVEIDETSANERGYEKEEAEKMSTSTRGTYAVNSSIGGSDTITDTTNHEYKIKAEEKTIDTLKTGTETGQSFKINVGGKKYHEDVIGADLKAGGSVKDPVSGTGVSAEAGISGKTKEGYEISTNIEYGNYQKKTTENVHTDEVTKSVEMSFGDSHVESQTKTWNDSFSSEISNEISNTKEISTAIHEIISKEKHYGEKYAQGGEESNGRDFSETASYSNGWSNTTTYTKALKTLKERTITLPGSKYGYYRLTIAGKAHVFGVVGYDVANREYFTYTYSVMDDDYYYFIDYSRNSNSFNDFENDALSFEIPNDIEAYVNSKTMITEGLDINQNGVVVGYSGDSPVVVIPTYYSYSNNDDSNSSIKVTGISENAFKGKNKIKAVIFSDYITEIPKEAFKDCTNLNTINAPAVDTIKECAFSGCTSLKNFNISLNIKYIGKKAFENVESIKVYASNTDIVKNVAESYAKNIILDISDSNLEAGTKLEIPSQTQTFEIRGSRKEYDNLSITSNANNTIINGIRFVNSKGTPLVMSSENVTFNQVAVDSVATGVIFKNNVTSLYLFGETSINANNISILCKTIDVYREPSSSITPLLKLSGDLYTTEDNNTIDVSYIIFNKGEIKEISADKYEQYLKGMYTITFDANGGTSEFNSKTVYYGNEIGQLPNASLDYHYLDGWYTEPNGGVEYEESSIVDLEENTTLYAHWKEKELSEWTIDSNVPSDAKIVNEYWKYDRHIGSYDSSLVNQGWTLVDTSLEEIGSGNVEYATFPSGFDTSNAIYNSLAKEPVAEYDDGSNVRKVENIFGGYIYWHWMYNAPYDNNPDINKNRIISQKSGNTSTAHPSWYFGYFDAIKSTVDCPYLDSSNNYQAGNNSNLPCYNCHNIIADTASAKCDRYFRFEYNISKYKDYRRIYTYEQYGLISDKPVYEVDGNVSIQHFVQYIPR